MKRISTAVLGATGVVGQRFVRHLSNHPLFSLEHLAASERSVGKRYADACSWRLPGEPYAGVGNNIIEACTPQAADADIVFSALDAEPALEIEKEFARAGCLVFSNASAHRMDEDVPLIIPELNAIHLELIEVQRHKTGSKGAIVTNPNCTTAALLGALGPLHRRFGAKAAMIMSMQAISGAGYPGVSALDALCNVIPYIKNEEEKVEAEMRKILGTLNRGKIDFANIDISAHCNRVPVIDGHTITMSVSLHGNPELREVITALKNFVPDTANLNLHTSPASFLRIMQEPDRPQPRLDVEADGGMSYHIGRIRVCPLMGIKLVVLSHNTERGAAGASILNAELACAQGYL